MKNPSLRFQQLERGIKSKTLSQETTGGRGGGTRRLYLRLGRGLYRSP
jgi:hypothetical protein